MYVELNSDFPVWTKVMAKGGGVTTSMYDYSVAPITEQAGNSDIKNSIKQNIQPTPVKKIPAGQLVPIKETFDFFKWVNDHSTAIVGAIGVGFFLWLLHRR